MSMLRCVFSVSLLIAPWVAKAQFNKGDRMVGASVASIVFNSGSSDITVASIGSNRSTVTDYNININPSMGWFLSAHTAVGAIVNINPFGNKTTYEQSGTTYQMDKSNSYNIGIGGFVRHYLDHAGSMTPFGQAAITGGFSNLKTEGFFYGGSGASAYKLSYSGNSTAGIYFNAAFTIGLEKMIGEQAGLDFFIGYVYSYNKNTFKKTTLRDTGNDGTIDERLENETTTKFNNHGFLAGIGFQIFLKKKK